MPNFAIIESNRVVNAIVAESQSIAESVSGRAAIETDGSPWTGWILEVDGWRPPSPYPSWGWDGAAWEAPVPDPGDGSLWDESAGAWVEVAIWAEPATP